MRRYETIFIINPDLSAEERNTIFDRLNDLIPKQGGFIVEQDEWGLKKLAYEIKKKPRGYYVRLDYCGTGAVVDEMERLFRIDDRVLKYMTIVMDKDVNTEKIKEELAQAEKEEKPPAQTEPVQKEEKAPDQTEPVQKEEKTPDQTEPVQKEEKPPDQTEPVQPDEPDADSDASDSPESDAAESDTPSTESEEKE